MKARILQYRRYQEFETLHEKLWTIYQTKKINFPLLPPKHTMINSELSKRRKDLQVYCTKILDANEITEIDVFYDFFLLNDIEFKEQTIIYDYRDLIIYEFLN